MPTPPISEVAPPPPLEEARKEFIAQWGIIGHAWGINRTMAQIHALLLVSPQPLCTDEIMESLEISRGNAHNNIRDLLNWGILHRVQREGERKDFFESEKDIWKLFCTISRERKRREVDPALAILETCADQTEHLNDEEGEAFHHQMKELCDFVKLVASLMDKLSQAGNSKALPVALQLLGK